MPFHMLEPLHDYRRPHQGIQDHSPTLLPEMFIHKRFTSSRLASHRRSTSKMKNTEKAREPPEDLRVELLRRPPRIPEPKTTRFFWRYCGGPSRPEFVVCLQVHEIRGLPPALNGRAVAVGWRTKGCRGETTLPVTVRGGEARFEEIFLHHCRGDAGDAVKGFCIWVSVIGAEECDLGRFDVDVAGMVPVDRMAAKFGGKVKRFELCGQGKGGELSVSIHCRMVGVELSGPVRRRSGEWLRENKVYASVESEQRQDDHQSGSNCKCLPRLRKPKRRKNRKPMSPQHRKNSPRFLPSEKHGFVTTDSSTQGERRSGGAASSAGEGNSGFITMEKGAVCPPPSSSSFDGDDVDGAAVPCLLIGYNCSEEDEENEWEIEDEDGEDTDLERVEEEFLQMLEDEKAISAYGFSWDGPDAELKSLIKMAEAEVTDAVQARKGRSSAGGAALEREEYEDLLKNWGSSMRRIADNSSSYSTFSSSSTRHDGSGFRLGPFGSPL